MVAETIKQRTLKGIFSNKGSSGSRARQYDPRYARKVGKSVSGPVDLYVTGELLSGIRGRARSNRASITVSAEIVGGGARQKHRWLEVQGAGRGKIRRRFMYITSSEGKKIALAMLKGAI